MSDIIDELAGITPGSRLAAARDGRPEARRAAQESYDLLLHPESPGQDLGEVSLLERRAVAAFVVALHQDETSETVGETVLEHYCTLLAKTDEHATEVVLEEAGRGRTRGPYGHFPEGPLSDENEDGLHYEVSAATKEALGERLTAALEHAHLLVFHPRDARSSDLQRLLDAGWTTPAIVTLSQLMAFLAFQLRVVVGLKHARKAFDTSLEVNCA